MRVYRSKNILILLALLFAWGCSPLANPPRDTTIDLSGISKTISKPPAQDCALEKTQDESKSEAEKANAGVKDFPASAAGENPYLKGLPGLVGSPEQDLALNGEGVLLNFDNADIYEVVQVISEILNLSFIIDPQVKGVVNIRSGRKIPMAQLFPVFKKLLNINGLDIRSEGSYNYIHKVAMPGAQEIFAPSQAANHAESSRLVIQVIPVMHMPVADAKRLLEPYKSEQGSVDVLDNPNTLFIRDYESKVIDMMMILAKIDVSPMANFKVRMVRVEKAPLFNMRDELTEIMTALKVNKQGFEGVTIMALERINSLLLVSSNPDLLESATRWIKELDVVPSEGRDNIYIYNVRNSVASELSGLVSDLIKDQPGSSTTTAAPAAAAAKAPTPAATTPVTAPGAKPPPTPVSAPAPAVRKTGKSAEGEAGGSGLRFAGQPSLIADDSRNIVLIRALPADYIRLQKLLERLDNMPRQVLIEVLVADVTLSDDWQMGVEWTMHKNGSIDGNPYGNYLTGSNPNTGISLGDAKAPKLNNDLLSTGAGITYSILNSASEVAGVVNAIAANNNLSVLSSPQVMVLNNETATVNVGESVPIVTSQTGDIANSSNLNQTIQYKDTGVILKVTPKINNDGIIILNIDQQVSAAQTATGSTGQQSPRITNRQLTTKLAVRDGQTVFMGGLIKNETTLTDSGVPLLKDIPLVGWLFKNQVDNKKKTEMLVMITPHVIESEDVLAQYVKSFNEKMDGFRKRLNAPVR